MKKIISIGKILLLTILFVLGTTNSCFATTYIYPSPTAGFLVAIPVLGVILAILGVIFVIALIRMLIIKINNSEELLSKSKSICENLLYYILLTVGLVVAVFLLGEKFILGILPLIATLISFILRVLSKKKASYIVLGVYLISTLFFIFITVKQSLPKAVFIKSNKM